MQIERVTQYRVDGHFFESIAKAQDFIDGEVNKLLQSDLTAKGFTVTECVKITDTVLHLRKRLAYLLFVELPEEDE